MMYFDNASYLRGRSFEKALFGESTSAYGVMRGLDKAFDEEEKKLRSFFAMGAKDRYCITSSWDDIPRALVRSSGRKKIGVFLTDTKATLRACDEARELCEVKYLRDGEMMDDGLLFLQYVHPLTGVIAPVEEAKRRGAKVALDVSYALGRVPLEGVLEKADYVMVRGAALGIPFGISFVAGRNAPFERRTTSLDELKAFTDGVEEAFSQEFFFATEGARLKALFEEGEKVLFRERLRAPHISCIAFPSVKNELLLFTLAKRDVFATIGGLAFPLLDRVLPCAGITSLDAMTALSFCFGKDLEEKDVLEAKVRLQRAVKELQVVSEGF